MNVQNEFTIIYPIHTNTHMNIRMHMCVKANCTLHGSVAVIIIYNKNLKVTTSADVKN